jgi:hypothetical protein
MLVEVDYVIAAEDEFLPAVLRYCFEFDFCSISHIGFVIWNTLGNLQLNDGEACS